MWVPLLGVRDSCGSFNKMRAIEKFARYVLIGLPGRTDAGPFVRPGDLVSLKCLPSPCPMYVSNIWEGRALVWTLGPKGRFWLSLPLDAFVKMHSLTV